jgi:hypothetical protein
MKLLRIAVGDDNESIVRLILEHGADVNTANKSDASNSDRALLDCCEDCCTLRPAVCTL